MPQHQLPRDHTGPSNQLTAPLTELGSSTRDTATATAAAVATALRAASISPANSTPSRTQLPDLKTTSLSPVSRPPRTSSLLPPPREQRKIQAEDCNAIKIFDVVDSPGSTNKPHHQHTSAAAHGYLPDLHPSSDREGACVAGHSTHSQGPLQATQASHNRLESANSPDLLVSLYPPIDSLQEVANSSESELPLSGQLPPSTAAPPFGPRPSFELLPSSEQNLGGKLDSTAGSSRPQAEKPGRSMPKDLSREGQPARGHGRRRSSKGSNDADRSKTAKPPSQKAMLSRALQKANTAVQLDNAQNLEGARLAYSEACNLLQQVLQRTPADEDKRKLEAIRQTYASRIEELDQMGPFQDRDMASKALPARPGSDEYKTGPHQRQLDPNSNTSAMTDSDESKRAEGSSTNPHNSRRPESPHSQAHHDDDDHPPPNIRATEWHRTAPTGQQGILQSSFSKSGSRSQDTSSGLQEHVADMPLPLQSNRTASPHQSPVSRYRGQDLSHGYLRTARSKDRIGHVRNGSQSSWLDAVGESGGSTASSIHSRASSQRVRTQHVRNVSSNTEAEFDTALDAAIEAAYDDGYEPMGVDELGQRDVGEEALARVLRKVEIARERVRQTEKETLSLSNGTDMAVLLSPRHYKPSNEQIGFYEDNSSDDEERMLEEMARDYDIGDFIMGEPVAMTSDRERRPSTCHGKTLTEQRSQPEPVRPLIEKKSLSNIIKGLGPSLPPPNTSLPELPPPRSTSPLQSVRSRRLSGQNPKQLKIDTTKPSPTPLAVHSHSDHPKDAQEQENDDCPSTAVERLRSVSHARLTPPIDITSPDRTVLISPGGRRVLVDLDETALGKPASPTANKLRKKFSSSSLRSTKSRNISLSNLEEPDMSPGTPSSNQFGSSKTPAVPTIPTPLSLEFRDNIDSSSTGARLFDDHFHQPMSPGSADNVHPEAPVPLEPCPNDFMLRPFWLMRCIFQTLVHPRGGYVSMKLFVPRDVWKVKGVKLKNVDDKIANCDLLTAALLKLAQVDTCDADAVLEEMQSLEGILEQAQASLTRKLGSEVGVQGSGSLFKEAAGDGDGAAGVPRSGSVSNKPSFSWRRLRSKSSGVGLGSAYNSSRSGTGDAGRGDASMLSLPITAQPTSRPPRRDLSQAQFVGPNANYMSSLARLFDAAQAVDQIARQVDDPGLRHADKTQVGLELCTRHAAEFFGFYICRFALADLGLLLEKFIKRGSEWVLA